MIANEKSTIVVSAVQMRNLATKLSPLMPNMYTVMHACIAHSCSALDVPLGLPWAPSGRRSDYMVSCLAMAHKAPQHSAMVACTVKSNIEQCYDINSALRAQHSDIAFSFTLLLANWAFRAPGAPPGSLLGPGLPLGSGSWGWAWSPGGAGGIGESLRSGKA